MKNIKFIIVVLFVLFTTSCNSLLDKNPLDEIGDDAFWKDPVLISYYINDLYVAIEVDGLMRSESRSDNSVHSQRDKWRADNFAFNYNLAGASNPGDDIWNSSYTKIRKCNRFLERIVDADIEDAQKELYKGQVYFLRALFYFEMVKRYGGVILLDKVLGVNDNWEIPRSSEKEVYDFILSDLDNAEKRLPKTWTDKERGRANKGTVWALKSRVQLYDKRYGDVINSCGEVYKLGYELVPGTTAEDYRSIWWITNKNNKEIIFDKQFLSPNVYNAMMIYNMVTYINNPYGDRGWGGLGPTQELIDEYDMKDGSPAIRYSGMSETTRLDINTTGIYKDREPRFYGSIVMHDSKVFLKGDKGPATVDRYLMDTPSKGDGSLTGYNIWKWIDYDNYNYPYAGASSKDHSINWIMLRLAEIILNDAEARIETNDVSGALMAVNKIRERVGLPKYTETDPEKLRQLIRKERRVELAFEDHRFWDVRRWKLGASTQKMLHGVRFTSPTEFYISRTDTRTWDDRLYLHPIPHSEILRISKITQNPGY